MNLSKKSKTNLIIVGICLICGIITLIFTKNFIYFIFNVLLFLAIYLIINAKTSEVKKKIAKITSVGTGIVSLLGLFTYLYSIWILPFMINIMSLPALTNIDNLNSLETVGNVFLIIGIIFMVIALAFFTTYLIISKKEKHIEELV